MCRTLSSWRLYSWMRLIWLSKMRLRIDAWPVVRQPVDEADLGLALRLRKRSRNAASSASGSRSRSRPSR